MSIQSILIQPHKIELNESEVLLRAVEREPTMCRIFQTL